MEGRDPSSLQAYKGSAFSIQHHRRPCRPCGVFRANGGLEHRLFPLGVGGVITTSKDYNYKRKGCPSWFLGVGEFFVRCSAPRDVRLGGKCVGNGLVSVRKAVPPRLPLPLI